VNLLGELLFASDHQDTRRFDAGESQPVPAHDCFQRSHNHVTNARVQVESGEGPFVHSSFDRIAGAAVRRRGQIHRRRPNHELEPVTERDIGRALEHLPNDLVLVAAGGCCDPLHRQVDVYR
jgi:hypothetical protein